MNLKSFLFLLLLLLGICSCSEGIVLDPPKPFGQEEITPNESHSAQAEPPNKIIALLEAKLNFPYATQTIAGILLALFLLGLMNKIYRLTTSYPE